MDNKVRVEAICITKGLEEVERLLTQKPPHFSGNDRKYAKAWVVSERQRLQDNFRQDQRDTQALKIAKQANSIAMVAAGAAVLGILIALFALFKP